MAGVWRVVHRPRVAVREEPRTSAGIARAVRFGQVLRPVEARGPWIRVLDDGAEGVPSGWVLSDGSSVGLGALLEASSLRPDAVIATAGAQAGRAERPGPSEVLSPGARLCDLGFGSTSSTPASCRSRGLAARRRSRGVGWSPGTAPGTT